MSDPDRDAAAIEVLLNVRDAAAETWRLIVALHLDGYDNDLNASCARLSVALREAGAIL